MFLINSCLSLFTAASRGRLPLSRSYGVNLPSSLTTLLPLALGFSPHLPVSVCGTGTSSIHTAFLASVLLGNSLLKFSLYLSIRVFPLPRFSSTPVSLVLFKYIGGAGIFCLLSIGYASWPRLRSRLTLGGRTFPRKP